MPLTLFMINSLGMISNDVNTVSLVNYVVFGVVGLVTLVGVAGFVIWLCVSVKELPK